MQLWIKNYIASAKAAEVAEQPACVTASDPGPLAPGSAFGDGSPARSSAADAALKASLHTHAMETGSTPQPLDPSHALQAVQEGSGHQAAAGSPSATDDGAAVIECIRREEFGLGLEASEEWARVQSRQHARLQRAVERLSKDLYSEEVHLLHELLQNADDCKYPPGNDPGAWLVLQDGSLEPLCAALSKSICLLHIVA